MTKCLTKKLKINACQRNIKQIQDNKLMKMLVRRINMYIYKFYIPPFITYLSKQPVISCSLQNNRPVTWKLIEKAIVRNYSLSSKSLHVLKNNNPKK